MDCECNEYTDLQTKIALTHFYAEFFPAVDKPEYFITLIKGHAMKNPS